MPGPRPGTCSLGRGFTNRLLRSRNSPAGCRPASGRRSSFVHLIRLGTPEPVKFNIFARINTGGTPLSAQELRHALIGGSARDYLRVWAELPEFTVATGGSVRSERMADREMVLRFVAFRLLGPEKYVPDDFDEFLRKAMRRLNNLQEARIHMLEAEFRRALVAAHKIFGPYAFRKRTLENLERRNPINKALFEVITVSLARLGPEELARVVDAADQVKNRFYGVMWDDFFLSAISAGTGQVSRVRYRFRKLREIIEGVL